MPSSMTICDNRPAAVGRIDYLDAAKGIFMILIITEHHLQDAEPVVRYLYSMGVPSFFLITGFLYSYKKEWEQPFGKMAAGKVRTLLYPFLTFSIINLLWNVLYYKVVFPSSVPEYTIKEQLFYTASTYGYNALWYLPCVLWGTFLFYRLRRLRYHTVIWAALSTFLVLFYILFDAGLTGLGLVSYIYCYLFRTAVAVVFLYAGFLLFSLFQRMNSTQENWILLLCTVFSCGAAVLYWLYPEHFPLANIAVHRMGNPYLYYLIAVSNTLVVLLICKKYLKGNKVLAYFGRNSLILMALHMDIFVRIAWYIVAKLQLRFGETGNSMIVIALELAMAPVFIFMINRFFPFLLKFPAKNTKN